MQRRLMYLFTAIIGFAVVAIICMPGLADVDYGRLTALSDSEMALTKGALFGVCGGTYSCPGPCIPPTSCYQYLCGGMPCGCAMRTGGSWGCFGGTTYPVMVQPELESKVTRLT